MSAVTVAFVGALTHRCPWLIPLFEEHLDDHGGVVLPHLYVANIERWAEHEVHLALPMASAELCQVLDMIEAEFASANGSEIAEVIAASFLEHLPRPGEPGLRCVRLWGPTCLAQLRMIG